MTGPTPDKVMQLITGAWASSILGAGARHGLFTALEGHPASAEQIAPRVDVALRGAQALLDGLTGLGLLTSTYRQSDYRSWLTEAVFTSVEIVPTPGPATFVLAK